MIIISIRKPIVSFLGHIDHGKTSLLDKIRGTSVQLKEAGGITQHIGATEIPLDIIKKISEPIAKKFGFQLKIPGILIIDTPGHEAFTTMRRLGGTLSDLAVLVIDINEGVMQQTKESIEILLESKTPFIVAANKIDLIPGWKSYENEPFLFSFEKQPQHVKDMFYDRLYTLIGDLGYFGINSDLFTSVKDFENTIAIVPVSAKTGEGIAELLLIIAGIAQKFLEKRLKLNISGPGKATIIEIKELKGSGPTFDVILYDGTLKVGDKVAFLTLKGPKITTIKGIYVPKPLKETRDSLSAFEPIEKVTAAAGIKVIVRDPEDALAGSQLLVIDENNEKEVLELLNKELKATIFQSDEVGVVVKADSFGTLQGLLFELKKEKIPVRLSGIGEICKEDILMAELSKQQDEKYGVVLGFNVSINPDAIDYALEKDIKIFTDKVIYNLIDRFKEYIKSLEEEKIKKLLSKVNLPCKFRILPEYIFRKSKPAIVGIKILSGTLRPGVKIIRDDGKEIGTLKEIQEKGETVKEVIAGKEVAVSIDGAVYGRNLKEDHEYYVKLEPEDIHILETELWEYLRTDEKELIEEYKNKFYK